MRVDEPKREHRFSRDEIPWTTRQLLAGEMIAIDNVDELPKSAADDRQVFKRRGIKALLAIPLLVDEHLEGSCVFSMFRETRDWTTETVTELKLIAENLASAVARSLAIAEIERLKDKLQKENIYLREEIRLAHGFDEIIGESPALRHCLQAVEKVAPTDVPVLILGETGTGKELFARAVHKLSNRRDKPIVSVNCPALPANIIESELFGHEKGAFTGAQSRRRGRFELADTGTLFLDEIGELPLELQSKLLRVLQTGEFQRLGGTESLHSDIRLIAATNRDLQNAIERGEFRQDLYYRINSFPIQLPALRDRKEDIPLLAEHFVHKHSERLGKHISAISSQLIDALVEYAWPGNVRELESAIERALISSGDDTVLQSPDPQRWIIHGGQKELDLSVKGAADLTTVERTHIISVLERTGWKISGPDGAAAVLGMPSSTLRSRMKRLGITRQKP